MYRLVGEIPRRSADWVVGLAAARYLMMVVSLVRGQCLAPSGVEQS